MTVKATTPLRPSDKNLHCRLIDDLLSHEMGDHDPPKEFYYIFQKNKDPGLVLTVQVTIN